MPRPVLLLACVLSLITGSALLATGGAIREPGIAHSDAMGGSRIALVRVFYDAVNAVLATGDAERLDGIVAPDFVEHPAGLGAVRGRTDFVQALRSRHALFPGLRLLVEALEPGDSGLVTARVRVAGAAQGAFLGLPIPVAFADWGPLDLFRIADGQIVEHWGSRADALLALPLEETSIDQFPYAQSDVLLVSRIRLAPGTTIEVGGIGVTELLVVEAGMGDVVADVGSARTLAAGEIVVLPPNERFVLRSGGTAPAVVLALTFWSSAAPPVSPLAEYTGVNPGRWGGASEAPAPGAEIRAVAVADVAATPGLVNLAAGRMVLAPDAGLSVPAGDRLLVVAVDEGRLEIVSDGGGTTVRTTLAAGEGTLATTGAENCWRAGEGGTTTLLVVTIVPLAG